MSAPAKPAAPNQPQEQKPAQLYRGIVKQVCTQQHPFYSSPTPAN